MAGKCTWCGKDLSPPKQRYCSKQCRNKGSVSSWRRRIKRRAVEYKGSSCRRCGYDRCVAAMVFHHPSGKTFRISDGRARSWEKIKQELDACELLCLNCHAEVHHASKGQPEPGELERDRSLWLQAESPQPRSLKKNSTCLECGESITSQAVRCKRCAAKHRPSKIKWPSPGKLKKMVESSSYEAVGRHLRVSGNAVKKHIKNHIGA